MGKSSKAREERRLQREAAKETVLLQKKRKKRRRLLLTGAAVLSVVAVAAVVVCSVLGRSGWFRRRGVSMETPHFKVTDQMMAYYIYSTYESYQQQYSDQLGLDAEKSLKKQKFREDATWFEYFALESKANLRQVLLFAEKAREDGVELSESELEDMDAYLKEADISAYEKAFALTQEDLRQALVLTSLASKKYAEEMKAFSITDASIDEYYAAHENYFRSVDYKVISFPYGENGWYKTAEAAKAAADILAAAKTADAYDDALRQVLMSIGATEENVKAELSDAVRTGVSFADNNAFLTWAFDPSRKLLDTYVEHAGSAYAVYQLTALPSRNETQKRNVRHILLTADTYGSAAKANEKAEELLAEWKAGEATEDSFAALAEKYTEDGSSKSAGGLYENIGSGEMEAAFDAWCFDAARKPGDTDIVKTNYGYHVMYYVGDGLKQWQVNVKNALISQKTDDLCQKYAETWTVKVHDGHINRLPL